MTYDQNWNVYLKALYWEKEGDWKKAHDIVQDIDTLEAAWIHGYLHRKEGDDWNANFWYTRAGQPFPETSLDEEWNSLWESLQNK